MIKQIKLVFAADDEVQEIARAMVTTAQRLSVETYCDIKGIEMHAKPTEGTVAFLARYEGAMKARSAMRPNSITLTDDEAKAAGMGGRVDTVEISDEARKAARNRAMIEKSGKLWMDILPGDDLGACCDILRREALVRNKDIFAEWNDGVILHATPASRVSEIAAQWDQRDKPKKESTPGVDGWHEGPLPDSNGNDRHIAILNVQVAALPLYVYIDGRGIRDRWIRLPDYEPVEPALKPCPICGGKADFGDEGACYFVKCDGCELTTKTLPSQKLATAAWNRRTP